MTAPLPEQTPSDVSAPTETEAHHALLLRVRQGDLAAKNELLGYCYPRVLRVVQARLGPRLRASLDPSDIVQDTMLEALQRLGSIHVQEFGQLIHWLSLIAYHKITGAARGLDRIPRALAGTVEASGSRGFDVPEPSSILSPSGRVATEEELRALHQRLDALPERQREVIYLRDFAEASWAYIAHEMGFEGPSGACMFYTRTCKALASMFRAP